MLISSLHLRKLTAFSWKLNSYPYKMFKKLENVIDWLIETRGSYDLVIVIFNPNYIPEAGNIFCLSLLFDL